MKTDVITLASALLAIVLCCAVSAACSDSAVCVAVDGDRVSIDAKSLPAGSQYNWPQAALEKDDDSFLGQLIVFLKQGIDPVAFGNANGLTYLDTLKSDPDAHIFVAGSMSATTLAATSLSSSPAVRKVFENRRSHNVLTGFVANDPYFHKNTPAGWSGPGQWHLINEFVPGLDVNIWPIWDKNITGYGVNMAVVDDCLQRTHPDLSPNYLAADSYDFGQSDADPSPVWSTDGHGTCTAGLAAARGGNAIGVTGAAPSAKIAGLRIDFINQTDAMFVDATQYHSSGTNTNIKIKSHSYNVASPFYPNDAQNDAITTSTAAGTIHVFSAGNGRGTLMGDCNKKQIQANADVIAVGGLGSNGVYADYSCYGASLFCTAPTSSGAGTFNITTTDRTGSWGFNTSAGDTFPDLGYTSLFTGTSACAPVLAGVLAAAKQVQPALNTRFAKHLLARTCNTVDPTDSTDTSDGGWRTNGAGLSFNQNYGFGLINANTLCFQARRYTGVTSHSSISATYFTPIALPDNDPNGVTRTLTLGAFELPIEDVVVAVDATHPYRGDIEVHVTSPSGLTSRLLGAASDSAANVNWHFTTNAFWGEAPNGTWTLRVADVQSGSTGTVNVCGLTLNMGELIEDTAAPTVTINQMSTQPDPCQGPTVYFTVSFSEWVDDFDASDIVLGGTAGATTAVVSAGAGRNYTIKVTGMTLHGTVTATIPAGAAHDAMGYASTASTSTDNSVTWNLKPRNLYISPKGIALAPDTWKTITSVYDDYNGATDILKAYLLLNYSLSFTNAGYLMYDQSQNKLYLKNNANTSWGTGYVVGSGVILGNTQIYLDVQNTQVVRSGKNLLVKWRIAPRGSFSTSALSAYQLVQDSSLSTPWQLMGSYP